jgi:lysyl-tRNA synthetase class 2
MALPLLAGAWALGAGADEALPMAVASGIAFALLVLAGPAFRARGDPATRRWTAIGVAFAAAAAVADAAHMRGIGSHPLVTTLAIVGAVAVVRSLGPWQERGQSLESDRRRAEALLAEHGADTLAPFALRSDKRIFLADDERAFLAYRVVAGVALVSGDPVGDPAAFDGLLRRFRDHAATRGWIVAALGVCGQGLALWQAHGFRAHYTGEEAVVDPRTFSLEGRSIRKVRQSVARLRRAGYRVELRRSADVDDVLAAKLEAIAERWRGGRRETGFSMAYQSARVDRRRDDLYAIAVDPSDEPAGFLHLAHCPAGRALSLSSMRRLDGTPNGLNEYLICETLAWAARAGVTAVSLNFAAFAAILDPPGPVDRITALEQRLLKRLSSRFQLERLLQFSRKFQPAWNPRYAVYPTVRALPRVALAAMIAEAYVAPPRLRRRGRP